MESRTTDYLIWPGPESVPLSLLCLSFPYFGALLQDLSSQVILALLKMDVSSWLTSSPEGSTQLLVVMEHIARSYGDG